MLIDRLEHCFFACPGFETYGRTYLPLLPFETFRFCSSCFLAARVSPMDLRRHWILGWIKRVPRCLHGVKSSFAFPIVLFGRWNNSGLPSILECTGFSQASVDSIRAFAVGIWIPNFVWCWLHLDARASNWCLSSITEASDRVFL